VTASGSAWVPRYTAYRGYRAVRVLSYRAPRRATDVASAYWRSQRGGAEGPSPPQQMRKKYQIRHHQICFLSKSKCTKIRFRPDPAGGACDASPDPLVWGWGHPLPIPLRAVVVPERGVPPLR